SLLRLKELRYIPDAGTGLLCGGEFGLRLLWHEGWLLVLKEIGWLIRFLSENGQPAFLSLQNKNPHQQTLRCAGEIALRYPKNSINITEVALCLYRNGKMAAK